MRFKERINYILDFFAEPGHSADLQILHYQYRGFNRTTCYTLQLIIILTPLNYPSNYVKKDRHRGCSRLS